MKIVFATDVYFPLVGGIQVVTRRLAGKLSDRGNEVFIIGPSSSTRDTEVRENNVKIYGLASWPIPFYSSVRLIPYVSARNKVYQILGSIRPDVIHVQTNYSIAKAATLYAKEFNVPLVASGHITSEEMAFGFRNFKVLSDLAKKIVVGLYEDIWRGANAVTSPSVATKKYFAENVHFGRKIISLSNGVDLTKFTPGKKTKNKRSTILFVGRLDPIKKVETIVRAMPLILKRIDADLILVGGGTEEGRLKALVRTLSIGKNVKFAGFLPENKVIEHLRRVDLFVISSAIETQGMAALEAIASGLPVVASDVGALPELVKNGVNGYLFPYEDSGALAERVVKILSDERLLTRMGKNSLKVAKKHDINLVIQKLTAIYRKIQQE